MCAPILASISLLHAMLAISLAKGVALIVLLVLALRQSQQSRESAANVSEVQAACEQLESRLETVKAHCDAEFCGIKGRLNRIETVP